MESGDARRWTWKVFAYLDVLDFCCESEVLASHEIHLLLEHQSFLVHPLLVVDELFGEMLLRTHLYPLANPKIMQTPVILLRKRLVIPGSVSAVSAVGAVGDSGAAGPPLCSPRFPQDPNVR